MDVDFCFFAYIKIFEIAKFFYIQIEPQCVGVTLKTSSSVPTSGTSSSFTVNIFDWYFLAPLSKINTAAPAPKSSVPKLKGKALFSY